MVEWWGSGERVFHGKSFGLPIANPIWQLNILFYQETVGQMSMRQFSLPGQICVAYASKKGLQSTSNQKLNRIV